MIFKVMGRDGDSFWSKPTEINEPITAIHAKQWEGFWGLQFHFSEHETVFVANGIDFENPVVFAGWPKLPAKPQK